MSNPLTVQEAAAELHHLINSRVSSPRQEELEAIIAKVGGGAAVPADLGRLAHWNGVVRQYLAFLDAAAAPADESLQDNTRRHDRLGDALCVETEAVWARPVRDWGDVILRAAVAVHWNSPLDVGDPPYPQNVLRFAVKDDPDDGYDVHAVAHVVRGVLDLARLSFDAGGRLLPTSKPSLSPEHLEHRRLMAAIDQCCRQEETPESEAQLDALTDQANALSDKIWQTPAVTPADVLLRAEVAMYHENGAMGCLNDPNAHYDDRAFAQLIAAVLNVWGPAHVEPGPNCFYLPYGPRKSLLCDPDARLTKGCRVVVLLGGRCATVGTIINERPTDFRTLRVRSEVDGCEFPMRFGRRTKGMKVGRVIAVTTSML